MLKAIYLNKDGGPLLTGYNGSWCVFAHDNDDDMDHSLTISDYWNECEDTDEFKDFCDTMDIETIQTDLDNFNCSDSKNWHKGYKMSFVREHVREMCDNCGFSPCECLSLASGEKLEYLVEKHYGTEEKEEFIQNK